MKFYLRNQLVDSLIALHLEDFPLIRIEWETEKIHPGNKYTLMIYDHDDVRHGPLIDMLVSNIPGDNIQLGTVFFNLFLNKSTDTHRHVIEVFQQRNLIPKINIVNRNNFPLEEFIASAKLTRVDDTTIAVDRSSFYIVPNIVSEPKVDSHKHPLIIADSLLTEQEKKFCSCVVDVAMKQPDSCNLEKAWFERREGEMCYNPFAVCAKSTGTSTRNCNANYEYANMTDEQLITLAHINNITLSTNNNPPEIITVLRNK